MKIIQTGKTDYESPNSIYKMYTKLQVDRVVRQVGHPFAMHLHKMVCIAKQVLDNCSNDSSSFQLHHLKDAMIVYKNAKADEHGLDAKTIKFTVHDRTAKVYMIASAMTGDELGFTN